MHNWQRNTICRQRSNQTCRRIYCMFESMDAGWILVYLRTRSNKRGHNASLYLKLLSAPSNEMYCILFATLTKTMLTHMSYAFYDVGRSQIYVYTYMTVLHLIVLSKQSSSYKPPFLTTPVFGCVARRTIRRINSLKRLEAWFGLFSQEAFACNHGVDCGFHFEKIWRQIGTCLRVSSWLVWATM